ncbi:MAG: TIGR00296 family protein, partial [Candidatus Korarchaeota archaeon]|nr:TIGR00296 family protein [Candidatus Korarchaeota archaeon]
MAFELSIEEGEFLVKLARKAVEDYLKTGKKPEVPEDTPKKLLKPCGVFVTINTLEFDERKLRGCIGYPYPTTPLTQAVIESSINSATQDPRFNPVSQEEIESIVFEVSILTPPERIKAEKPNEYPSKIEIGKDGLIVEQGMRKGLLLP